MSVTLEQIILAQEDIKVMQEETKLRQDALEAMIKAYEEQAEAEFPKDGDTFYFLKPYGEIGNLTFREGSGAPVIAIGNCFRTKEEAEFAVEQLKVIAEMKRCGGVWKTRNEECEYYLWTFDNLIHVARIRTDHVTPDIIFPTEAQAQKAIDTIGEERLLKYWFCVEG